MADQINKACLDRDRIKYEQNLKVYQNKITVGEVRGKFSSLDANGQVVAPLRSIQHGEIMNHMDYNIELVQASVRDSKSKSP